MTTFVQHCCSEMWLAKRSTRDPHAVCLNVTLGQRSVPRQLSVQTLNGRGPKFFRTLHDSLDTTLWRARDPNAVTIPHTRVRRATGSTAVNDGEANFIVLSVRHSDLLCAEGGREKPERNGQVPHNTVAPKTGAGDTISVSSGNRLFALCNQGGASTPTAREGVKKS